MNFFVFSSLGRQATTVVSPREEFNRRLPPLILGHMAEGHGEHYISLMKASADVISDVLADRGLINDVDLTNCWSPPLEEPRDTLREDVTTKCVSPQRDDTEVKLHNDVLLEIIRWSLIGDCSMLGTLNRVSQTFRDLTRSFEPLIHMDDHLIDKLELNGKKYQCSESCAFRRIN